MADIDGEVVRRSRIVFVCALACVFSLGLFAFFASPSVAQAAPGKANGTLAKSKEPVGIMLDAKHFPDFSFRSYLWKFDKNGDGALSKSEVASVTRISVPYRGIKSLSGVGYFANLRTLDCTGNRLSSLKLSKNTKLSSLSASRNRLKSLDVSKNRKLVNLYCARNKMSKLNVAKLSQLKRLNCSNNRLMSLDVSKNKKLQKLSCQNNGIKSLSLSNNKKLTVLDCFGNKVKKVRVYNRKCLVGCDRKVKVIGVSTRYVGRAK